MINKIIAIILKELPDVKAIYIFGSSLTARVKPDSDVDIAILPTKKLLPEVIFQLSQKIAQTVNRDIDLIDLLQASEVMRAQIVSSGKRCYCVDKNACEYFEMLVYSMYVRLNEERQPVLEEIKKRGQIY